MGRQTAIDGAHGSGSGGAKRLDPASLPVKFDTTMSAPPTGGAARVAARVYLDRDTAIIKRPLAGLPLTLVVPIHVFQGVAVEITPGALPGTLTARLFLRHADPALCVPLREADNAEDLADDWAMWGESLKLPLLMCEPDGTISTVSAAPGSSFAPDRRRVYALTARRPRFLNRRKTGRLHPVQTVHRGEREIIARH
ncbi:DUF6101 family protein [Pannonibacter tanglangensis]|uniref:DUF6101 family protein n=1 Tax=Pannonibacter tanglangensis TaxID=2750084 RepID=UPI001AD8F3DC|nr:DUF6101 family protein [Pannonibacter sp. XCT-34]